MGGGKQGQLEERTTEKEADYVLDILETLFVYLLKALSRQTSALLVCIYAIPTACMHVCCVCGATNSGRERLSDRIYPQVSTSRRTRSRAFLTMKKTGKISPVIVGSLSPFSALCVAGCCLPAYTSSPDIRCGSAGDGRLHEKSPGARRKEDGRKDEEVDEFPPAL